MNIWADDPPLSQFFKSTGTLVNTVDNAMVSNERKAYILLGYHYLEFIPDDSKIDNIWISFDYELPDMEQSTSHIDEVQNQYSIQKLYKTPCKVVLGYGSADMILLEVDFSNIPLEEHKAFLNAYALGWNLHPDFSEEGFNFIAHHSNGPKKININYKSTDSEIKTSNRFHPEDDEDSPYKYIGLPNNGWFNASGSINNAFIGGCCGGALLDSESRVIAVNKSQGSNTAFFFINRKYMDRWL